MIVAIPCWHQRVSPVLDVAGQLLLVERDESGELARSVQTLGQPEATGLVGRLRELGVDTLICGALSRGLEEMLTGSGIEIIPRVCGDVEEVLAVYCAGRLRSGRFAMPGCCGRRGGCRHGRRGGGRRGGTE